jgi:hypothetical protein
MIVISGIHYESALHRTESLTLEQVQNIISTAFGVPSSMQKIHLSSTEFSFSPTLT